MDAWVIVDDDDGKIIRHTLREKRLDAVDAFLKDSGMAYSRGAMFWALRRLGARAVKVRVEIADGSVEE